MKEINDQNKIYLETDSILERFDEIRDEIIRLINKVTIIEHDKILEQTESENSVKLKNLLNNYENNEQEIYELLRTF